MKRTCICGTVIPPYATACSQACHDEEQAYEKRCKAEYAAHYAQECGNHELCACTKCFPYLRPT
jgi:hypothetical protein